MLEEWDGQWGLIKPPQTKIGPSCVLIDSNSSQGDCCVVYLSHLSISSAEGHAAADKTWKMLEGRRTRQLIVQECSLLGLKQ
jgi:hypothetical protein